MRISPPALYRVCIWLPIVVPAVVIGVATVRGRLDGVVWELLAYSLLYGGVPYAVLGIWATWWIRGRSESDIRRVMFRAPPLMASLFVPLALIVGVIVGAPGPFAAVAVLGCVVILLLGYTYVGITMVLRWSLGPSAAAGRIE